MTLDALIREPDNYATAVQWAADQLKQSLYHTAKTLLGFKDVNEETHGRSIKILESQSTRKLLVLPRGFLKSSLACTAFPIYLLLSKPNLRILIDSELYTNSSTFLREIKGHITSPNFVELFGDWKTRTWNESEIIIGPRTKNYKEASITCGGIGTTRVGQHYDVIIGDDYNSPANTNTIENARKVVDHYKYNLSILEPDGTYVVIGTRYSANDLIQHILDNEEHDYKEAA